jgi:hypothetical protein
METGCYLEPHQARTGAPDEYQNALADAIEAAFAAGHHDLDALVRRLNEAGPPAPSGSAWTAELFCAEMQRLGA